MLGESKGNWLVVSRPCVGSKDQEEKLFNGRSIFSLMGDYMGEKYTFQKEKVEVRK